MSTNPYLQHLISPEALAAEPGCIVFDCRFALTDKAAGRRAYAAAHIPGARFADLEQDLSAPAGSGGRHPLPDRAALAARLGAWGANDDSPLVCYDQNSGAVAARFWWLVRWLGHGDIRLLDGGLNAWIAAGLPVTAETPAPRAGRFSLRPALTRTISAAELREDSPPQLLDAREAPRFRGEQEAIDPVAGHIPGAISAAFAGNLGSGRFLPADDLRERFRALDLDPAADTACYCGSGVTAAHNILALLLAGYPEARLYPGSWSEWIVDPERPIAVGD